MRRVVTGSRPDGSSFVARDDELPELSKDTSFLSVWEADGALTVPSDGAPPPSSAAFFPPPSGFRVMLLTLWPGTADAERDDWEPDRSDPRIHYWTNDVVIDPSDPTQNTWYVGVYSGWGGNANDLGGLRCQCEHEAHLLCEESRRHYPGAVQPTPRETAIPAASVS